MKTCTRVCTYSRRALPTELTQHSVQYTAEHQYKINLQARKPHRIIPIVRRVRRSNTRTGRPQPHHQGRCLRRSLIVRKSESREVRKPKMESSIDSANSWVCPRYSCNRHYSTHCWLLPHQVYAKKFHRKYSGQPELPSLRYRGTATVLRLESAHADGTIKIAHSKPPRNDAYRLDGGRMSDQIYLWCTLRWQRHPNVACANDNVFG